MGRSALAQFFGGDRKDAAFILRRFTKIEGRVLLVPIISLRINPFYPPHQLFRLAGTLHSRYSFQLNPAIQLPVSLQHLPKFIC